MLTACGRPQGGSDPCGQGAIYILLLLLYMLCITSMFCIITLTSINAFGYYQYSMYYYMHYHCYWYNMHYYIITATGIIIYDIHCYWCKITHITTEYN